MQLCFNICTFPSANQKCQGKMHTEKYTLFKKCMHNPFYRGYTLLKGLGKIGNANVYIRRNVYDVYEFLFSL